MKKSSAADRHANTVVSRFRSAHIPPDENVSFDTFYTDQHEQTELLKQLARERFRNHHSTFIFGRSGNGSSHLIRALHAYLLRKYPSLDTCFIDGKQLKELILDEPDAAEKYLSTRELLFLDNTHEWMNEEVIVECMARVLSDRHAHQRPVIGAFSISAEFRWPGKLGAEDNALFAEVKMPSRKTLFQLLRARIGDNEQTARSLPEFALFHAITLGHDSVLGLIEFTMLLVKQVRDGERRTLLNSTLVEQYVNEQYRKFKKQRS